jgi:hypothetical protein
MLSASRADSLASAAQRNYLPLTVRLALLATIHHDAPNRNSLDLSLAHIRYYGRPFGSICVTIGVNGMTFDA